MHRTLVFAKRNFKELSRDLLALIFTILLPVSIFLLMLFLTKQLSIPNTSFEIQNFTPATIIFSFSFLTLFTAMLVAQDRSTAFLTRLLVSPLKASNYIVGYMLPIVAISIVQNIILFTIAIAFGLPFTWNIFLVIIVTIPISVIFSSWGIIMGSILNSKQASGITSLLIQVVSFTSGMWFDLNLIGGTFKTISYILPFAHSVDLLKYLLIGDYAKVWMPLIVVFGYMIAFICLAIILFKKVGTKK